MGELQRILDRSCTSGHVPGAGALVARDGEIEIAFAGEQTVGGPLMSEDTIVRIASITKPIVAAATMVLIERGLVGLDDPIDRWLDELAEPVVLRTLDGPVDDVVPAERQVTVRDLLTFSGGLGLPQRFDLPIAQLLFERISEGPPQPQQHPAPDEWLQRVATVPLLHQPGQGWTYNTGAELLGVLLGRAAGGTLFDVLTDTVLGPVGMADTAFFCTDVERIASLYQHTDDGLELIDPPDGQWAAEPPFLSGGGGLLSTVRDWYAFGAMLLAGGEHDGHQVLTEDSVRQMTSAHVDGGPKHLFLDGQGWGFGGGVDLRTTHPWNVPGRYGWVGGTGTAGYLIPSTGTVVVWMCQVQLGGPDDTRSMADVLTYAAR
ncbi:serine hydrolase domain-containing protein [Microlunatus soli]|nr:serine hydrolase domain-containing protein [Microlunatus soli]